MNRTTSQLDSLAERAVRLWHRRRHYAYQERIRKGILDAMVRAKAGETVILPVELPRQSGKTSVVVDTVEFLLVAYQRYIGKALAAGIFAPQKEQATTDFDRLRTQFVDIAPLGYTTKVTVTDERGKKSPIDMPEKWNSKTIRIYQRSGTYCGECYIFPISKQSRAESKTLGLAVIEEAQDADDDIMKNSIFPMLTSTNGVRVLVGTAGTRNCYFKRQLDTNPLAIKITLAEVFRDRRAMYEATGDDAHLYYEKFYQAEERDHGLDSDYIQRQFHNKWILGSGSFMTPEQWNAMLVKGRFMEDIQKEDVHYVGLDTAKQPDRTVCTVIRKARKGETKGKYVGCLSLQGINYEEQFAIIVDWLKQFRTIRSIAIDSTGQGDFMPDKFETHTSYNIIRFKFGAESKDALYKNMQNVVANVLTQVPDDEGNEDWRRLRKEMLELEKEYRGRLLSVHHPEKDVDGRMGHDDYPDSWALAEWAYAESERNRPAIHII